jgi:magnesium transporter
MNLYAAAGPALDRVAAFDGPERVIWADLVRPTPEDLDRMSALLGVPLPTREDQEEIEQSSRLYFEGGVPVMTVLLPAQADAGNMTVGPVSFLLLEDRLVTVRHHDPRPFSTFPGKAGQAPQGCGSAGAVLFGLLEEIIDRLADITEQTGRDIDAVSGRIFSTEPLQTEDYRAALRDIGKGERKIMHLRESLTTMERMLGFLVPVIDTRKNDKGLKPQLKTQSRDIRTIAEQAGYLQQKTAFLLDAALGLISIEQNAIIKIFSVAAVAFLPPTLVASIYGMNFAHMPELAWPFGYPVALGLMLASAGLPLLYFRRRGWL